MAEPFVELLVPPPVRGAFIALEELDDEAASAFLDAVTRAEDYGQVKALQELAREAFPAEKEAEADLLIPGVLSLRGQMRDTEPEDVANALSQSPSLDLDVQARDRLRERLLPILQSEAVSSTANAMELLTQHTRNFRTARVLTDIRPIFSEKVDEAPTGAVLIQTLQLDTWDRQGKIETFHVALDEVDLRHLGEVVERAATKSESLRELLRATDLTLFELDEEST